MKKQLNRSVTMPLWAALLCFVFLLVAAFTALYTLLVTPAGGAVNGVLVSVLLALLVVGICFVIYRFIINWKIRKENGLLELQNAMKQVAEGKYDVHLQDRGGSVAPLVHYFNQTVTELTKVETLKSDFVNNVSHEFKTPTASIYGYATALITTDLTQRQRALVDVIVQESQRLSKLTSSVYRLSKVENLDMASNCTNYSLDEQLRSVVLLMAKKAQAKHIEVAVELERIYYLGDEELLYQVWQNILENAIKYSNVGGVITISCKKHAGDVIVCIQDTGSGMTVETKDRLFDKFYQGNNANSSKGSGLGLAIVKRVVDISGGTIKVESCPGAGTDFFVYLPEDGALHRL